MIACNICQHNQSHLIPVNLEFLTKTAAAILWQGSKKLAFQCKSERDADK